MVKADFADLKEKHIKDLLAVKTWAEQKELLDIATKLQAVIGTDQHNDFNEFEDTLKAAIKDAEVDLDAKQKKQIIAAVSWPARTRSPSSRECWAPHPKSHPPSGRVGALLRGGHRTGRIT